jgi:hypothetical protein
MGHKPTLDLERERRAVEALRGRVASDEWEIAIEGETNLFEAIAAVMVEIDEAEMMRDGIGLRVVDLEARCERLTERVKFLKLAIQRAMEECELPTVKLADVTISLKRVPPALQITDETKIGAEFFKPQPPRLDRKALGDALKVGAVVLGATLDNGGASISFRRA